MLHLAFSDVLSFIYLLPYTRTQEVNFNPVRKKKKKSRRWRAEIDFNKRKLSRLTEKLQKYLIHCSFNILSTGACLFYVRKKITPSKKTDAIMMKLLLRKCLHSTFFFLQHSLFMATCEQAEWLSLVTKQPNAAKCSTTHIKLIAKATRPSLHQVEEMVTQRERAREHQTLSERPGLSPALWGLK